MMELLSPAGTMDKMVTAFDYGADAVYLGLKQFSMRANAGNFTDDQWVGLQALKERNPLHPKKVYCAVNILFHENDLYSLRQMLPAMADWPFDGYIVSDLGAATLLKEAYPDRELHLSTQASCINSMAAKAYHAMGFSRIVVGRETPLDDIRRIKDAVPGLEIEAFVHGAMCMAYSGRCLLSSHLTGRSGNQGDCAHTCRWNYRLMADGETASILASEGLALEEAQRPGTYYPISEQDGFTTILSSKDLCMVDHLRELRDAGVDSLKIEGRMKSLYYVAVVTRAYRKAIDALDSNDEAWKEYREDLFNISHREYSTGFFFGHGAVDPTKDEQLPTSTTIGSQIDVPTQSGYFREYLFLGTIGDEVAPGTFELDIRNQIRKGQSIEFIGPDVLCLCDNSITVLDADLQEVDQVDHCKKAYIRTELPLKKGYLVRRINTQTH